MKRFSAFLLIFILIAGVFSASGAFAASKCECSVVGQETVYSGEKITVFFFVDAVNVAGFQGTVAYDKATLKLEELNSKLSGKWILEKNEVDEGSNFIIYGGSGDSLYGKQCVMSAVFAVNAPAGTSFEVSLKNIKVSDGQQTRAVSDAVYSATVAQPQPEDAVGLSSLSVSEFVMSPKFSPEIYSYNVTVPFSTEKLEVLAKASSNAATVDIQQVELAENAVTPVNVTVTYNNQSVVYTIYAFREPDAERVLSSNAAVTGFQLSDSYVEPEFSDDISEYAVTLSTGTEEFYISPLLADPNAYFTVEGDGKMNIGENSIKITVISEDLSVQRVFRITVSRLEAAPEIVPEQNNHDSGVLHPWFIAIIVAVAVILVLLAIVLFSTGKKKKKKKEDK